MRRNDKETTDSFGVPFSPELFILGGGVSKKHRKFPPLLSTQAEVLLAELLNEAGIVGAALAALAALAARNLNEEA